MAICKYCQKPFAWGNIDGKFVPLVPIGEDFDLDRTYQDENGVLRAEHRSICTALGGPTVRVVRLAKAVPAGMVLGYQRAPGEPQTPSERRARKAKKKDRA